MTSLFGTVTTTEDVRAAVETTIRTWSDTYVAEVARAKDTALPRLRSYGQAVDEDTDPDTLPACLVVCPGILAVPQVRGDGTVDATFAVGVGIVIAHQVRDTARRLASLHAAAMRALMLQQGSLGGFARAMTWTDEDVDLIDWNTSLVVAAASLQFAVDVDGVVSRYGGPLTPPEEPTDPIAAVAVETAQAVVHQLT